MYLEYSEIEALVDAGSTNQQIADALNLDMRQESDSWASYTDPDVADFMGLLVSESALLYRSEGNAWSGPLNAAMASRPDSDPLRVGWRQLLTLLNGSNQRVTTSTPERGALCEGLIAVAEALGHPSSPTIRAEVYKLTGGRRYGSVTAQDVQDCRDREATQVESDAREVVKDNVWEASAAADTIIIQQGSSVTNAALIQAFTDKLNEIRN